MMLPGPIGNKAERYALPARVGQGDVDELVVWLVRTGGGLQLTLDFTDTAHIDFRAVRLLVDRVREVHMSLPPIRIVGLDPYCEQILRFALAGTEWDLSDAGMDEGMVGTSGGDVRSSAVPASSDEMGGTSWGSLLGSWTPCPN